MSDAFDTEAINLMSRALQGALARLATLGLVDGDADRVRAVLSRFIMDEVHKGERDEEQLIALAMDHHTSGKSGTARTL